MSGCYALIVAAGRGSRLGGDVPKQYRRLAGQPVLRRTVAAFLDHPAVSGVRVVIHPDDAALYAEAVAGLALLPPVHGGATRQDSVRLGLESLAPLAPERVLIHDAARPFIAPEPIAAAAAALDRVPGALVAVPVVDTIKRENGAGGVGETVDRRGLWRAQTPQAFRFDAILAAHRAAHRAADGSASGADLTDDAAVAERAGLPVVFVPGDEANFKITTEADLARAERAVAAAAPARVAVTGTGFDVHAFETVPPFRDHVWLCGVKVPHARGLVGHSDADVALHALTDAVLGAVAEGDIGAHFSDRDPRWRGASSDRFLAHAVGLASAKGGRVVHLDVTIICEAPRVRPHHAAMVARVAAIAGLAPARVSVKGTTTERLGFTGRGEGIAAQAAATVLLPEPA